jgi:hypothetical protein
MLDFLDTDSDGVITMDEWIDNMEKEEVRLSEERSDDRILHNSKINKLPLVASLIADGGFETGYQRSGQQGKRENRGLPEPREQAGVSDRGEKTLG